MTHKTITVTADRKSWRELEAAGVKRCCGIFTNGKRCRRRASEKFEWSWCEKCGPTIQAASDFALKAMTDDN